MSWRYRFLDIISNPSIAYILLMLGIYGIFFELSSPGAILPGVVGGIFLILAFYALQMLPDQFCRIGSDSFCHHPVYCRNQSGQSWIVSGWRCHLSSS